MHTRSALLLLALFVHSVHTTDLDASSPSPIVKRDPENNNLHARAPSPVAADPMIGLIEVRAPSDFDHIARSPTPAYAAEPDPLSEPELESDSVPPPEAAAGPVPFTLESDSQLLEYEGAEILEKRADCPANPLPSAVGCPCTGQSLCKKRRRDRGICYFLQRDEISCGTCFHKCGATQQCKKGICQCSHKSLTACGTTCVNTLNDSRNCGRCGNWCSYNRTCRQGKCRRLK